MRRDRCGSAWGERTIRNGTVRFYGKTYRVAPRTEPDINGYLAPAYDGRLDGMRGLFHDYNPLYTRLTDSIYLHSFGDEWPGPHCIGGVFCWDRWVEVA